MKMIVVRQIKNLNIGIIEFFYYDEFIKNKNLLNFF